MPVTVVVGCQFGSEGKGKVAHFLANEMTAAAAIRVGGPNSGHTVIGPSGEPIVFRQLPTAALLPNVVCVLPAGSYVNTDVLLREVASAGVSPDRVAIDPHAMVITKDDRRREEEKGLRARIGSTLSGTGAAVQRRIDRDKTVTFAKDDRRLSAYVRPTLSLLRELLDRGQRVIIEGTQGFGLSLLHGTDFPHVTSRDTTAAAFVSEAGLSPFDVDDIALVIRTFPIRVAGNSGLLPHEIDWGGLTRETGSATPLVEFTSVTHAARRVARFDPGVVLEAIRVNQPTRVVLNHLDYIDPAVRDRGVLTERALGFLQKVASQINHAVDYVGVSRSSLVATRAEHETAERRPDVGNAGRAVRPRAREKAA